MLYFFATLLLLASLYLLLKYLALKSSCAHSHTVQKPCASADDILRFFHDAETSRDKPIEQVVDALGHWDQYDDWDWGRVVYEWRRPGLRLRVITQGGLIREVERLDPDDRSRFGTVVETLLTQPPGDVR